MPSSPRFTFVALGSLGDVLPLFGMARGLRARGHTVHLITTHNFVPRASAVADSVQAVGEPGAFERALDGMDMQQHRRALSAGIDNLLLKVVPVFEAVAAVPADAVVANTLSVGARLAAREHRLPFASVISQTVLMRSAIDMPVINRWHARCPAWFRLPQRTWRRSHRIIDRVTDHVLGRPLRALCKQHGWAPVSFVDDPGWYLSPSLALLTWPRWFSPLQADAPSQARHAGFVMYDGEPEPDTVWRQQVDALPAPPLVFAPGSWNKHGLTFFEAAVGAAQALGRPAVLLTPYAQQLPAHLPPNIIHLPYVRLSELLPHAAAIVHHGGPGTAAHAIASATPQLSLPQMFDQFDNTRHLQRLGVGATLADSRHAHLKANKVADALDRLLSTPSVTERNAHWQQALKQDTAFDSALDSLEALVR